MDAPLSLIRKVESTLDKRFKSLTTETGPFRSATHDVTWAAGIEMEATYVLNPLDTTVSWNNSFKQFYVPNSDDIIDHIEKKGYSKSEKYPMLIEAEASGRACAGITVVDPDPRNSMFEIATQTPYQVFRPLRRASDILWYAIRIADLQQNLIRDLNQFYNEETLWKKKKKYFSIVPYPFAMTNRMLNADIVLKNRKRETPKTNYTGSYHITLTLPFSYSRTSIPQYLEQYKRYINQFQWIEPLILAMYSTGDMRAVGSTKRYPRASYRIMLVGWGNPGGSDVRKFEEGLNRKANIELYWRKGLNFLGQNKLERACADPKRKYPLKYVDPRRNVYDMGADFRTPITRPIPKEYLKKLTKGELEELNEMETRDDQWRFVGKILKLTTEEIWGSRDLPPDKLFGVEMRILDYFPARYMPSMLRILIFIAENARRTPNKMFVYQDKDWIGAMHAVMKLGWRAELPAGYIRKLEKALDLKFPSKPRMAEVFWGVFLRTLHKRNHDGMFVREMLPEKFSGEPGEKINANYRKQPPLYKKNVNRDSWDFAFLLELHHSDNLKKKVLSFILGLPDNKNLTEKELNSASRRLPKDWKTQWKDVLYFFSLRDGVTVRINKDGFLVGARTSAIQKEHCKKVIENIIGEIVKLWPELLVYAKGKPGERDE